MSTPSDERAVRAAVSPGEVPPRGSSAKRRGFAFEEIRRDTVRTIDVLNVWRGVSLVLPAAGAVGAVTLGGSLATPVLFAGAVLSLLVLAGTKLASAAKGREVREAMETLAVQGLLEREDRERLQALSRRLVSGEEPAASAGEVAVQS